MHIYMQSVPIFQSRFIHMQPAISEHRKFNLRDEFQLTLNEYWSYSRTINIVIYIYIYIKIA